MAVVQNAGPQIAQSHNHVRTIGDSALPFLVAVFIIGLVIPLIIDVGALRLNVYRIILLILFFPSFYLLLSGKAGRIRLPDICVVLICVWSSLSLIIIHGFASEIEAIGILIVETLGAYLIGRCFIRSPEAFHATAKLLFWLVMLMLPFAIYEATTSKKLILELFGYLGPVRSLSDTDPRLGFSRVQGPFAHPIHFGVFCGSVIGLSYYVVGYGKPFVTRITRAFLTGFTGAGALSSGPMAALAAQLYFIVWDVVLNQVKSRWYIFGGLAVLAYVTIDIFSNRSPFAVFITYFAFNESTGYNRIYIWRYGLDNILTNPLFGLGNNSWVRPSYMSKSIDMFWIVPAIRHGIPVWILYFTVFFSIVLAVIYKKNLNAKVQIFRFGYLCTMSGLFIAGWTVHYWAETFAYFMFLLGAGVWFLDHDGRAADSAVEEITTVRKLSYTRFPPRPPHNRTEQPPAGRSPKVQPGDNHFSFRNLGDKTQEDT